MHSKPRTLICQYKTRRGSHGHTHEPFFILSLKPWSISLVFVISLSQSVLHFLCAYILRCWNLPNIDSFHLSACSTAKDSAVFTRHRFLQSSPALKTILLLDKQNIRHTLLHQRSIYSPSWNFMCTVTWSSKNHNKDMLLWSSPAFLTSLLY